MSVPAISLRPYQADGLNRVVAALRELPPEQPSVLVVSPVGSGKSILIGALCARVVKLGGAVLVLQHRKELIDQNRAKIVAQLGDAGLVGVVRADDPRRNVGAPVQVASVDTLRAWLAAGRALPRATVIIIDEAHRSCASTYRAILAQYPGATVIGFTATPWRLDGQGLGDLFGKLVVVTSVRKLVEDRFLVPVDCWSHPVKPELQGVATRNGEYVEKQLAERMSTRVLLGAVVEQYRKKADGRSAFGFAVTVEHAEALALHCREAGIPSVAVHGNTPDAERDKALRDLRAGALKILWNCSLFTEGTDVPEVKCVILMRPTKSRALAFQMVGRGMRPAAQTGYEDCQVLDHAGVLAEHGHPLDPQDYSLDTTKPRQKGEAPSKECPSCGRIVSTSTLHCPCGYEWTREGPEKVEGDLVKLQPKAAPAAEPEAKAPPKPIVLSDAAALRALEGIAALARQRGVGNLAAYTRVVYQRRYHCDPPPALLDRVTAPPPAPAAAYVAPRVPLSVTPAPPPTTDAMEELTW